MATQRLGPPLDIETGINLGAANQATELIPASGVGKLTLKFLATDGLLATKGDDTDDIAADADTITADTYFEVRVTGGGGKILVQSGTLNALLTVYSER